MVLPPFTIDHVRSLRALSPVPTLDNKKVKAWVCPNAQAAQVLCPQTQEEQMVRAVALSLQLPVAPGV